MILNEKTQQRNPPCLLAFKHNMLTLLKQQIKNQRTKQESMLGVFFTFWRIFSFISVPRSGILQHHFLVVMGNTSLLFLEIIAVSTVVQSLLCACEVSSKSKVLLSFFSDTLWTAVSLGCQMQQWCLLQY